MAQTIQKQMTNNIIWFMASLAVAVLVWFIASLEANPIEDGRFRVDIQIITDDNMIITNNPRSSVQVDVQAQANIMNILEDEDIVVTANLEGREAGTYTVPLDVAISRPASADTVPAQITVTLEQLVTRQKPVHVELVAPSASFVTQNLEQSVVQAEVSGALDAVSMVDHLLAEIDLSEQRAGGLVDRAIQLVPVDVDGNMVTNVTIQPRTVNVTLDVVQRDDVREVNVRPFILFNTLPENFEFDNLNDWEPRSVLISGSPEALEQLGSTVDTEPISLAGRTSNFVVDVPLDLPDGNFIVLSGNGTITVDIAIREEAMTISLENIPVNLIGVPEDFTITSSPEVISVVLNGPQSLLSDLTAEDIQAVIDVNGLLAGTNDVIPQISIRQGQVNIDAVNVTLLPARVSVTLIEPTPEATDEPTVVPTESTSDP